MSLLGLSTLMPADPETSPYETGHPSPIPRGAWPMIAWVTAKAADLLADDAWGQGAYIERDARTGSPRYCLVGAINAAIVAAPRGLWPGHACATQWSQPVKRAVAAQIGTVLGLESWNDLGERRAAEVVEALRATAATARAEAAVPEPDATRWITERLVAEWERAKRRAYSPAVMAVVPLSKVVPRATLTVVEPPRELAGV